MIRVYLLGFLTLRGLLALAGIAALCAVIVYGGPHLSAFGWAPLVSDGARAGTVAAVLTLFFGGSLLRLALARRANARMIKSLLDAEGLSAGAESRGGDEVSIVRARFEEALTTLKDRIFPGRSGDAYLFELPWYAVIGPPGSGKTAILRHSGLDFPLAPRLGAEPVAGLGATRHCDWWFADQAVLIDTAGRYVTQDQDSVDGAEWRGFLNLLKTHRSRRPLNGVLLVVSLRDILLHEPERRRHVTALRARLHELSKTSGIGLPVYLVVSKCDLMPGFAAYFDDLDEAARSQVWGMTFPADGDPAVRLPETFERLFHDLAERLEAGLRERAHAERDLSRRGQIYLFPKEFAALGKDLAGFIQDVFRPNRFEATTRLRGIYFTSATQQGAPLDRTAAAFGRGFGLPNPRRSPPTGPSRAYFITRVLTEVAFAEQGLAGVDRRLERKLLLIQNAGYAAAALTVVGLATLWWAAESRSEARVAATSKALDEVQARLHDLPAQVGPAALLPVLQAADAVRSESGRGDILAALDGLGLSATLSLVPAAEDLRRRLLLERLHPVFVERLGERIAGLLLRGGDAEALRALLRSYLMLGDPERFEASVVRATARDEARLAFAADQDGAARLNHHLDDLITLLPKPSPLDWRLVEAARSRLMRTPRSEQVYARLLREAATHPRLRPVDLATSVGPGVLRFTTGPGNEAVSVIPQAFTREAFYTFVLPRLPVLIREEVGIDWVTAGQGTGDGLVQTGTREVMDRYAAEYIRRWRTAVLAVRLSPAADRQQALAEVQALAGPDSPLERLIGLLRTHTDLPLPGDQAGQAAAAATPGPLGTIAGGLVAGAAASAANAAAVSALGEGPWPGTTIAAPFRPLTELTAPPGADRRPWPGSASCSAGLTAP
ncbi:type VI secretion system membrane subunit TssM [Methylobacterium persicinum]